MQFSPLHVISWLNLVLAHLAHNNQNDEITAKKLHFIVAIGLSLFFKFYIWFSFHVFIKQTSFSAFLKRNQSFLYCRIFSFYRFDVILNTLAILSHSGNKWRSGNVKKRDGMLWFFQKKPIKVNQFDEIEISSRGIKIPKRFIQCALHTCITMCTHPNDS